MAVVFDLSFVAVWSITRVSGNSLKTQGAVLLLKQRKSNSECYPDGRLAWGTYGSPFQLSGRKVGYLYKQAPGGKIPL